MRSSSIRLFVVLLLCFSFVPNLTAQNNHQPMLGFDAAGAADQRSLEAKFDSFLKADNLRAMMKRLSARPHHVGSPYDKDNAEYMLSLYKQWGYDAQIEEFAALFPTPKTRVSSKASRSTRTPAIPATGACRATRTPTVRTSISRRRCALRSAGPV